MSPVLRRSVSADHTALHRLDEQCIDEGWSLTLWQSMLANPRRYQGWLLEEGGVLLGYVLYAVVLDEAELLRIGIRQDHQGVGLGYRLLSETQALLQAAGVSHLHLEVRDSNSAAQALYRKAGWAKTGRRRNYYPADEGSEDALLFGLGGE